MFSSPFLVTVCIQYRVQGGHVRRRFRLKKEEHEQVEARRTYLCPSLLPACSHDRYAETEIPASFPQTSVFVRTQCQLWSILRILPYTSYAHFSDRTASRKMATLQEALTSAMTNVGCLKDLALPDEQPVIEPEPASVVYEVSFDTNFADRTAFITGIGRYNEEATKCSALVCLLFLLLSLLHCPPLMYWCVQVVSRFHERICDSKTGRL